MDAYLEKSFVFYASYHSNPTNKLLHIICVWPILITGLLLLSYTPSFALPPLPFIPHGMLVNITSVITTIYVVFFLAITSFAMEGIISSLLITLAYYSIPTLTASIAQIWTISLAVHILGWVGQLYGHKVHEKRSPALMDNLLQALLMAPLFVVLEVLFEFGYKPEFRERTSLQASRNIGLYKASLKKQ